jgi:hypothetical protein
MQNGRIRDDGVRWGPSIAGGGHERRRRRPDRGSSATLLSSLAARMRRATKRGFGGWSAEVPAFLLVPHR